MFLRICEEMNPEVGVEAVLTVGVLAPWTTLMMSTGSTETVIILLEEAEEGEQIIMGLVSN